MEKNGGREHFIRIGIVILGAWKEFQKERFSYLNKYKQILGREKPLPKLTDADVEEFI